MRGIDPDAALLRPGSTRVEVFRPAGEAPQIAREAIKVGKVLWLQLGIVSEESSRWPRRPG
jgi:predicted CoA-binding protein